MSKKDIKSAEELKYILRLRPLPGQSQEGFYEKMAINKPPSINHNSRTSIKDENKKIALSGQ